MANKGKERTFSVQTNINLESREQFPPDAPLMVAAFDSRGQFLGNVGLDEEGCAGLDLSLKEPMDIDLVVGPAGDPQRLRKSPAFIQRYSAQDWKADRGGHFHIQANPTITKLVWKPWLPIQVCVSGHVRKVHDGEVCPVPFVKVEIFDVDREACIYPFLDKYKNQLAGWYSADISNLIKGSIPKATETLAVADMELTHSGKLQVGSLGDTVRALKKSEAPETDRLTLTSLLPPWEIYPACFYSKQKLKEASTDQNGFFNVCFKWWPFYFRNGRLRYDAKPDIIIRVTQIIDGVETVIYMDPYSSTRWNVNSTHIDLYLENDNVQCGSGDDQDRPAGAQVFFSRVGDDEVYRINQTTGLYNSGSLTNVAYGAGLLLYGQFGENISDGSPQYYYRLSKARVGSTAFSYLNAPLNDTRVRKSDNFSEQHFLGPHTINNVPALYEIRNFDQYLWYNPDLIGAWNTAGSEPDTGKWRLRLEVFNASGQKLTSSQIDYLNGTVAPPATLPPMGDHCDLILTLDNKAPDIDLNIPAVINPCGVIPFSSVPPLNFIVEASQENGRLYWWRLDYVKGVSNSHLLLDQDSSSSGSLGNVNQSVSGNSLLVGLTSTCAFGLRLRALPHIRNGRHFVYHREIIKAIAIDK